LRREFGGVVATGILHTAIGVVDHPGTPNVSMVLVGESADAADDWKGSNRIRLRLCMLFRGR
jgi:hypothetical protein